MLRKKKTSIFLISIFKVVIMIYILIKIKSFSLKKKKRKKEHQILALSQQSLP